MGFFKNKVDPWYLMSNYRIRDFLHRIANGDFGDDVQAIRRSGDNPDVGTSWEEVTNISEALTWLSSAEKLQVVSNNAEDDINGNGAQKIKLEGLDANYEVCI